MCFIQNKKHIFLNINYLQFYFIQRKFPMKILNDFIKYYLANEIKKI